MEELTGGSVGVQEQEAPYGLVRHGTAWALHPEEPSQCFQMLTYRTSLFHCEKCNANLRKFNRID